MRLMIIALDFILVTQ